MLGADGKLLHGESVARAQGQAHVAGWRGQAMEPGVMGRCGADTDGQRGAGQTPRKEG